MAVKEGLWLRNLLLEPQPCRRVDLFFENEAAMNLIQ
jgi:hypothetical protein